MDRCGLGLTVINCSGIFYSAVYYFYTGRGGLKSRSLDCGRGGGCFFHASVFYFSTGSAVKVILRGVSGLLRRYGIGIGPVAG